VIAEAAAVKPNTNAKPVVALTTAALPVKRKTGHADTNAVVLARL